MSSVERRRINRAERTYRQSFAVLLAKPLEVSIKHTEQHDFEHAVRIAGKRIACEEILSGCRREFKYKTRREQVSQNFFSAQTKDPTETFHSFHTRTARSARRIRRS